MLEKYMEKMKYQKDIDIDMNIIINTEKLWKKQDLK